MYYSTTQKQRASELLSGLNLNGFVAVFISLLLLAASVYVFIKSFADVNYVFNKMETTPTIAVFVTIFCAFLLLCYSISYVHNLSKTKQLLKKIKLGGEVRGFDVNICPCCDSKTTQHVGTYTTGSDNTWMGTAVNMGGKYGAKKMAGGIGEFLGSLIGSFLGVPDLGGAVGKTLGKQVGGEMYDENVKSAVSSNFKNDKQVHTYTYYSCPAGCVLPANADDLKSSIDSNTAIKDPLFGLCRRVLVLFILPYIVLILFLGLILVVGILSFVLCLLFSDLNHWLGDWHWYVGGVWSWLIELFSYTWYSVIPAFVIMFMLSCLVDDGCDIKREAKYLEFGINYKEVAVGHGLTFWVVLFSAASLFLPAHFIFPGDKKIQYDSNGYEYVDLGLSVCWATTNLGANQSDNQGHYLSWGEVKPKNVYSDQTYQYRNVTANMTDSEQKYINPRHDAAHRIMGGDWRMPTFAEFEELLNNCEWSIVGNDDNVCYVGKSLKNGNQIILPASGQRYTEYHIFSDDEHFFIQQSDGCYWTCDADRGLTSTDGVYAGIAGTKGVRVRKSSTDGFRGLVVRPVLGKKTSDLESNY